MRLYCVKIRSRPPHHENRIKAGVSKGIENIHNEIAMVEQSVNSDRTQKTTILREFLASTQKIEARMSDTQLSSK